MCLGNPPYKIVINFQRSPFSNPVRSLLKLVTMKAGEFEFDDIFRLDPNGDRDGEEEIPFEGLSYILWIVFIVLMPILLTNMLVSPDNFESKLQNYFKIGWFGRW